MIAARSRAAVDTLARESLPIVVCSALLGGLAILVPEQLSSDGWLALVDGRLIAHGGLPHHDTLAALTAGRTWIDQQWLGQLGIYALETAGGIRLVLAVNLLLVAGAFVAAAAEGRRRGGRGSTVALIALLLLLPFLLTAMNVRTQSLVYLPAVALLVALSRARRVDLRLLACVIVLLVVWANVHGSVLLGVVLASLRGAVGLWETRPNSRRTRDDWLMLIVPWFCPLVSPYHIHVVDYYAKTAFNPTFASYLSQWAPTTFSPLSASLLVVLFAVAWMIGRTASAYSLYERIMLVVTVALGLLGVRDWSFAVLFLLILAPVGFDRALRKGDARPAPRIGAAVALVAVAASLAGSARALVAPSPRLTKNYSAAAGVAVAHAAARPGIRIYAGIEFADWLLWTHPALVGHVVLDVRYELLRSSEVKRLVLFDAGSGLERPLGRPDVYILDPNVESHAIQGLRPDVRTIYETDRAFVAVRRPRT